MENTIQIQGRKIGHGHPAFIIAEMSANHHQDFDEAVKIIHAAKECGADAVKLQTFSPDTHTIDMDNEYFQVKGTLWGGETLYSLYKKAYMPWEWQPRLKEVADKAGIILFSAPVERSGVDLLEKMNMPAYKLASFELVDLSLIEYIATKGKPLILSTGMATMEEISDAVTTAREAGLKELALLKCTSAYPAKPEEMNLKTIPHLAESFNAVAGLSDHTLGITVPIVSVALGASIIEKHFTISRANGGLDAAFSLEPEEFRNMVKAVRTAEKAIGTVSYSNTADEAKNKVFKRSLFIVKDVKAGEELTEENVRSIRPGYGIKPKHLKNILGKKAKKGIKRGTPLSWDLIDQE